MNFSENNTLKGVKNVAITYSRIIALYTTIAVTFFGLLFLGVGVFLWNEGDEGNKKRAACGCNNDQVCVTDECTDIPEGNASPTGQMWWGAGIGVVALIVIIGVWWRFVLIKNNDSVAAVSLFTGI